MNLPSFSRWILLGAVLLLASLVFAWQRSNVHKPASGCHAECPTPPAGCERTTVDPGACADEACSKPPPTCHYAPTDAGAVCPPTLAGRCIPPQ